MIPPHPKKQHFVGNRTKKKLIDEHLFTEVFVSRWGGPQVPSFASSKYTYTLYLLTCKIPTAFPKMLIDDNDHHGPLIPRHTQDTRWRRWRRGWFGLLLNFSRVTSSSSSSDFIFLAKPLVAIVVVWCRIQSRRTTSDQRVLKHFIISLPPDFRSCSVEFVGSLKSNVPNVNVGRFQ